MAQYDRKDHYYRKAKAAGLASRAAFKLEEIQQRFRIVRPGHRVVDLGCAPGGWLQPLAKWVGPGGRVVGIDLLPVSVALPEHVLTVQADLERIPPEEIHALLAGPADVVVSDMAPNTSGTRFQDQARSAGLAALALDVALGILRPGGHFVAKIFDGPDLPALRKQLATHFQKVHILTPAATRKGSIERYLVGIGKI